MISNLEKILPSSSKKRTYNSFIDSVISFNQGVLREERPNILLHKILEIYLELPGLYSASLFQLDYSSYEFTLRHQVGINNPAFHQKIFEK